MKVLILGSSGMLGQRLYQTLVVNKKIELLTMSRGKDHPNYKIADLNAALKKISVIKPNFIINCIGLTKPYISNSNPKTILEAIDINSIFPQKLGLLCESINSKLIQITTDCVFSGKHGGYSENSPPDPEDVYGMSKYLGEINSKFTMNLRCSIVGPNKYGDESLYSWVQRLPLDSTILGFTNHLWNGVTSFELSRILNRILENTQLFCDGTFHIVPSDIISKYSLISLIIKNLGRDDLIISEHAAEIPVNRSLSTLHSDLNRRLWGANDGLQIPKIHEMNF